MADSTPQKKDPTVTSTMAGSEYPEGTHPARPVSETTHGQPSEYKDNPDKPDPTTVAQIEIVPEDKGR